MKIYKNLRIFTMDKEGKVYDNGYIKVSKGKILAIGNCDDLTCQELEAGECVDCKNKIAMPGMITTHAHFYGTFARGMQLSQPICNWQQMLTHMWWKFDKKLTFDQCYYSAMLGLIDGLKSGTTTFFDHQASPNATDGVLDILEKAVRQAGARACLSYEVSDRDGTEHRDSGIRENERFIKKTQNAEDSQISALFGMHAGYSLSRETLEQCAQTGKELDCGFHVHIAESEADVAESYRLYDMHVMERMYKAGILGEQTIAAHCVHLGPEQWELLQKTGTTAAYNVQSNTNNAVGICPAVSMLDHGVNVALGGDGYTYDLYQELGFGVIMQRIREKDPRVFSGEQIRRFAFENPGNLGKRLFGVQLGMLEPGAAADIVLVDYQEPTPITGSNFLSHMTSAFSGKVTDVIVNGKTVVRDRHCTQIDEEKILAECKVQADQLWKSLD